MLFPVHFKDTEGTVDIPSTEDGKAESFRPAFEVRFPAEQMPNGYAYQQFYLREKMDMLYMCLMKSTTTPFKFTSKDQFLTWAQRFFMSRLETDDNLYNYLNRNRHKYAVETVARGIFSNFALIDNTLYKHSGSPVYEVTNIGMSPFVRLSTFDETKGFCQFRYDEKDLIIPYLDSIISKDCGDGHYVTGYDEALVRQQVEDFCIKPIDGFSDSMPSRDIRIMDWLEREICGKMKTVIEDFTSSDVFTVMRKVIQENNGLSFCCPLQDKTLIPIIELVKVRP